MILIDTNLLTRLTDSAHPHNGPARRAISKGVPGGGRLAIVPQSLFEFWAVATRRPGVLPSGQNGLGMTPPRAGQWVRYFRRRFTLLPDRPELSERWLELVERLGIKGVRSHDARLVAAMQSYGIDRVLTFNAADFRDLPVAVVDPASL